MPTEAVTVTVQLNKAEKSDNCKWN